METSILRARAAALAGLSLMLAALAGCSGEGSPSNASTLSARSTPASAPSKLVAAAEFAAAVADAKRVTINVHVPDEGSIDGTDLSIPFDQIEARRSELPGPATPLAVYCRSGAMSAEAVQTLARLGYRDIVELDGGMIAWEETGRKLLPPRQ